MYHSKSGYGENLFSGSGSKLCNGITATNVWYNEVSQYDYKRAKFVPKTGHFTQVIWKKSVQLGIAKAVSASGICYISANYDPPGNVQGAYESNVQPPIN